jgi:hypothetical protein
VAEFDEALLERIQRLRVDFLAQAILDDDVGDGARGAGRTVALLPELRQVRRRGILEMAARRQDGRLERRPSTRPPMKNDRLCLTVPTLNDSTFSISCPRPRISSVEPPPISITSRRSPGWPTACATPM